MKVIGITGGVGSGKSEVLNIINNLCSCYIIRSDELAKALERKGQPCYEPLIDLLGESILGDDGEIVPAKMAAAIFMDKDKSSYYVEQVNSIIHPVVKSSILSQIEEYRCSKNVDYFFIEAALLIEDHYDLICDELWYIYTDEFVRRERLKDSRQYSDAKIDAIMSKQLPDAVFRDYCKVVIDNSGDIGNTRVQLENVLKENKNLG